LDGYDGKPARANLEAVVPGQKSQHFVSQFHLRNFGHGESSGLIRLHNRRTGLYVPHAPIKTQACADYFYEKGDQVEHSLAEMENRLGPLISGILKDEAPPKWGSQSHIELLKFVVFQSTRTRFAKDQAEEGTEKHLAKIEELFPGQFSRLTGTEVDSSETPRMLLSIAEINYHAASDLRCKLLRNGTGTPFITSDHPVVRYNQYFSHPKPLTSNTGLGCRGLQVFFPLSAKYLLVLFDSEVYKVGERNFKVTCVDVTKDDVEALNILQVVNAGEHLYFSEEASQAYVEVLVNRAKPYLKMDKATATAGPAIVGGREHGTIVASSLVDVQTGLNLSCMKITPKAKERYSASHHPKNRYRNPEMQEMLYEFTREVLAKRMKDNQFEEFRRRRVEKRSAFDSRVARYGQ
jgi:hypothetical protein